MPICDEHRTVRPERPADFPQLHSMFTTDADWNVLSIDVTEVNSDLGSETGLFNLFALGNMLQQAARRSKVVLTLTHRRLRARWCSTIWPMPSFHISRVSLTQTPHQGQADRSGKRQGVNFRTIRTAE